MSLEALQEECSGYGRYTPEYYQKMLHKIPVATVVDRVKFIVAQCKGKKVLNMGCAANSLHSEIIKVAASVFGIDKIEPCDLKMDFDNFYTIEPLVSPKPEIIVCGEVLEHLSNPGIFLKALRFFNVPLIITTPNAFCDFAASHMKRNQENVNVDHVAWYSWRTLTTLVERCGYVVKDFHWYNGRPLFAEGMVMVVE